MELDVLLGNKEEFVRSFLNEKLLKFPFPNIQVS